MIVQSNERLIHTISGLYIKTCEKLFNCIYGLQEKCKNMAMRFQSPLVYVSKQLIIYKDVKTCVFYSHPTFGVFLLGTASIKLCVDALVLVKKSKNAEI